MPAWTPMAARDKTVIEEPGFAKLIMQIMTNQHFTSVVTLKDFDKFADASK